MSELFDDINFEKLAQSDSPFMEEADLKSHKVPAKEKKDTVQSTDDPKGSLNNEVTVDEDAMSEEEMANYDPFAENEEEDSDDNKKKNSKTPASEASTSSPSDKLESNTFKLLASALHEAGVISSVEAEELEKVEGFEGIADLIQKQIKANELGDLDEEDKEFLKARRNGVSRDTFIQKKNNIDIYKGIKEETLTENQQLRAELIRRNFLLKGFSAEESTIYAQRSFEAGKDLEDSKLALKNLITYEEESLNKEVQTAEQKRVAAEKEESERLSKLKSKINEKNEFIEGVKFNSKTKENIFDSITKPVGVKEGKPVNDLLNRYLNDEDFKIKLHYFDLITNGLTDFSKLVKTSKTRAVEELSNTLQNTTAFGSSGKMNRPVQGSTTRSILDALDSLG